MSEIEDNTIEIYREPVTIRRFKSYDHVLSFISFVEPESCAIDTIYQVSDGNRKVIGYQLKYSGSEGME